MAVFEGALTMLTGAQLGDGTAHFGAYAAAETPKGEASVLEDEARRALLEHCASLPLALALLSTLYRLWARALKGKSSHVWRRILERKLAYTGAQAAAVPNRAECLRLYLEACPFFH